MSGAAVTWNSKKQATVALSTTEAEYMAMSAATQEAMWLKNLLHEIDKDSNQGGNMIHCDNKGAMELGLNGGYRARSKYIDVRHHYVRQKIQQKLIQLQFVGTDSMVADALTKSLPVKKFQFCVKSMGLKA